MVLSFRSLFLSLAILVVVRACRKQTKLMLNYLLSGIIYHGNQSSTSSDLSPMSEQKSLPRRGRSRYHQHNNTTYTTNTTPRHRISTDILSSPLHHNPTDSAQQATLLLTSSPPRTASYLKKSNYSRMSNQFKPIQHRTIYTTTHQ